MKNVAILGSSGEICSISVVPTPKDFYKKSIPNSTPLG